MHARVREPRPHLNEAQVEAAIVFKQVEEQCAEVAQQRRTMTAAALQRRALVSKKARAAEAALAHEDAVRKRAVDAQARRDAEAKRRQSEQLFMMIKAGSKLQLLPLYAHVGLILRGLRDDPPPPAPSRASDQRYTPEEAAKLVSAEEIHDGCGQLLAATLRPALLVPPMSSCVGHLDVSHCHVRTQRLQPRTSAVL